LILDLAPSCAGAVHDIKQYRNAPMNEGMKRLMGLANGKTKAWFDSAYQSIERRRTSWKCFVSFKAQRGKELTDFQKQKNKAYSKVRIRVEHQIRRIKVFRICSDRLRKPSEQRHFLRWRIAAGLANLKALSSPEFHGLKTIWT